MAVKELRILIVGEGRTVALHITDPVACAAVPSSEHSFLEDVALFSDDVLASNPDAGQVNITPANVADLFPLEHPKENKPAQPVAEIAPLTSSAADVPAPATVPAPVVAEPVPAESGPAAAAAADGAVLDRAEQAPAAPAPDPPAAG